MGGALDPVVAAGRRAVAAALTDLEPGAAIVLGVSGGADSLALAALTAFVARQQAWSVTAVVVDHGLQAGSAQVAERAVEQCRGLGLLAEVVRVEVGPAAGPGGGPEAAARTARRAALVAAADDLAARVICLGHTLDDQAETVLLGLGRGAGARSLAGMAAADGLWRRPLLGLRRAETERICAAHRLDPWHDPHNLDPALRRVRVRRELLPLAEDVLAGGVAEALARTARSLRADADALDAFAGDWLAARAGDPDLAALAAALPAIRSRVLLRLARGAGCPATDLTATHVAALDHLVLRGRRGAQVHLPGSVTCVRSADRLTWTPTSVAR